MNDPLSYDAERRVITDANGLAVARDVGPADAIRITEALSICADLPPVLRDVLATHIYDADQGEEPDPDNPLVDFISRAENATADEPDGAPPAASAEPLFALLDKMLAFKAAEFEGEADDCSISGSDMVDAFASWRAELKAALVNRPASFTPPPIGLLEIADELSDAIGTLQHQLDQVCQLHNRYTDDSIVAAHDEGDEAVQRLAMYRKATETGPATIVVNMDGGLIQDVSCTRNLSGVEVLVIDYDTEGAGADRISRVDQGNEGKFENAIVSRYNLDDPSIVASLPGIHDAEGGQT